MIDLQEIEARLDLAVPAPWEAHKMNSQEYDLSCCKTGQAGTFMGLTGGRGAPDVLEADDQATFDATVDLVTNCPTDLRACVDEIKAKDAEIERLRAENEQLAQERDEARGDAASFKWAADRVVAAEDESARLRALAGEMATGLEFVWGQLDELINRHYGGELPCSLDEAADFEQATAALESYRAHTETNDG